MNRSSLKKITESSEITQIQAEVRELAIQEGLDFFETIFELVDYRQMNEIAAYAGFPRRYPHWRFGMEYDKLTKGYAYGLQKIYELVINHDPCYAYLLRSNQLVDQKLVIAHVYAHSDFFKNNLWFRRTNRKMIDVMANHGAYIQNGYEKYGRDVVENFIDLALSIENLIDFYALSPDPGSETLQPAPSVDRDVLLFLIENAPLTDWQMTILSIVRDEAYYFAPQMQTKIINEGWAAYWHSRITNKILKDSEIVDYADHHSGTLEMRPGQINPYKIGLELFRDVEERWNKGQFGASYEGCQLFEEKMSWNTKAELGIQKIFEIRKFYNDVTFIDEFLTPEFVEKHKLFIYGYNRRTGKHEILDRDWKHVKERLLLSLTNLGSPFMTIADKNLEGRGELLLKHDHFGVDLKIGEARETMAKIYQLWQRPIHLVTSVTGVKKLFTFNGKDHTERAI